MLAREGAKDKGQALAGQRMSEHSSLKLAAVQPAKLEAAAVPDIMQSRVHFLECVPDSDADAGAEYQRCPA